MINSVAEKNMNGLKISGLEKDGWRTVVFDDGRTARMHVDYSNASGEMRFASIQLQYPDGTSIKVCHDI